MLPYGSYTVKASLLLASRLTFGPAISAPWACWVWQHSGSSRISCWGKYWEHVWNLNTLVSSIRPTDLRNKLLNCPCSRRDTLRHGIETSAQQNCPHRLWTIDSMLDAMYKDRCFNADKKQGLREMLHTQLDKMKKDCVHRGRGATDRDETSLFDMHDEILVENETTE